MLRLSGSSRRPPLASVSLCRICTQWLPFPLRVINGVHASVMNPSGDQFLRRLANKGTCLGLASVLSEGPGEMK